MLSLRPSPSAFAGVGLARLAPPSSGAKGSPIELMRGGAAMPPMISIAAVTKRYKSGLVALDSVDLEIAKGEIFALLGPNGAGKTTLIGVTCGTVSMTSGRILIDGHDVVRDYRAARAIVGLVPQEIALDIFSTVLNSVSYSRRLFGRTADPAYIERLL